MRIHVWHIDGEGWFWDDAEDHGGYDRCVPCGPFRARIDALKDAESICGVYDVEDGPPLHYPDDWEG